MHLGAKHNYILEFAPQNVIEQLQQLGVNWLMIKHAKGTILTHLDSFND